MQKIIISAPSTLTTSKLTTRISEEGDNPASMKTSTSKDSSVTEISDEDGVPIDNEEDDGDDDNEKDEETNDKEDENDSNTTPESLGTIPDENEEGTSSNLEKKCTRSQKYQT